MGKWGGVSKIMDFRIDLFFLSFFISNQVILERGMNPLIIPIPVSLISLDNLRSIIGSSEVTSVIKFLSVSIGIFSFNFYLLHININMFY
jgi:hypothetical protein